MIRMWIIFAALGALLGGNVTLFIAAAHEFRDASAQRLAVVAERHAIEGQRAAIDQIGQHMREWLAGARRCKADTQQYGLPILTGL
jgi:hypothetical protein